MSLTSIILSKNEEDNIEPAIRSVEFADEIIVVDDNSNDKTVEIAESMGAKVFKRSLNGDFSKQRNFALRQARGDWVFFVDADEKVSTQLKGNVLKINENYAGFYLKRKNLFLGKVVGEDKVLRIAKKDSGKWERIVHEEWKVKGKLGTLGGYLIHETARSLKEAVVKTNFYSSLHAKQNLKDGKKSNLFKIILFPVGKLLENLVTGKGFVFGFLHALHSFLAWSKQWLLQRDLQKKQ